jgi:hypothetical protein
MADEEQDRFRDEIVSKMGAGTDIDTESYRWLAKQSRETETLADKENSEIIAMRKKWANWILWFIGTIIVFDIVLVSLYGFGIWDFKDTRVVIAIVTENFLKIISLGVLVTIHTFKKIF